jgi:hypothetical protein
MVILYCQHCGVLVRTKDLESGAALQTGENTACCPPCAVKTTPRRASSANIPAAARDAQTGPLPARETRLVERGTRAAERRERPPLPPSKPPLVLFVVGAVVAVLVLVFIVVAILQSGGDSSGSPAKTAEAHAPKAVSEQPPPAPAPPPEPVKEERPRPGPGALDPLVEPTPKDAPTAKPPEPEKPTPQVPVPPVPPTPGPVERVALKAGESRVVTVEAKADWQDAGVLLMQGQRVRMTVTGRWQTMPGGEFFNPKGVGPGGWSGMEVATLPFMALIGRPPDGQAFLVGEKWEGTWPTDGGVSFRPNDQRVDDNLGALGVTLEAVEEKAVAVAVAAPLKPVGGGTLARMTVRDKQINGGGFYTDFWGKGKDRHSLAIWGRRAPRSWLSASFNLAGATPTPASLVVTSLRHDSNNSFQLALLVNGREIFNGWDPAVNWEWAEHRFPVPAGLLRAGANEIRVNSLVDTDWEGRPPWYMVEAFEVRAIGVAAAGSGSSQAPPCTVAKLLWRDFAGGGDCNNFSDKNVKPSKAIWGKRTPRSTLTASFDLGSWLYGAAALRVISMHHGRSEACKVSFTLNGREIFNGPEPSTQPMTWSEQCFPVPNGVLKPGANELRISDLEDSDKEGGDPWYMIHSVDVEVTEAIVRGGPEEAAFRAPRKRLESGGLSFGPETALRLRTALRKNPAAAKKVLFAGPGWPNREVEFKAPEGWSAAPPSRELTGPAAAPLSLLDFLPEQLAKENPEAVFLCGEASAARKVPPGERADWEDAARLCLRLGALPVWVPAPATGDAEKDEGRQTLLRLAEQNQWPVVELQPAPAFSQRAGTLLGLFEKHVFCRVPLGEPGEAKGGDIE